MDRVSSSPTDESTRRRARIAATAVAVISGISLGLVVPALVLLTGVAGASSPPGEADAVLDATHLPPLLRLATERAELRYDVHCAAARELADDAPCDAVGGVFAAASERGPYRELSLRLDPSAVEGRYVAEVPSDLARRARGFAYYAVFRSASAGRALTLPAGGVAAPQWSLPLTNPVEVTLGAHRFGTPRRADERVAAAAWGDDLGEVGLEEGRNVSRMGGSSFDVGRDGTVHLLDEAHRRVLRWAPDADSPTLLPVPVDGRLADLVVGDDGRYHILEMAAAERKPLVRTLDRSGREVASVETAERTASQIRLAGDRPLVLEQPSGQWMASELDGRPLGAAAQRLSGRPGRAVPGVGDIVVLRTGNEIRAAIVSDRGVERAWRVTSETPIAEVQLAEPLGQGILLVTRVFTGADDEFVVLLLGPSGIAQRFSVTSQAWAETAPLGRFRLHGSSLFELRSTASGVFIDRFDLGVS